MDGAEIVPVGRDLADLQGPGNPTPGVVKLSEVGHTEAGWGSWESCPDRPWGVSRGHLGLPWSPVPAAGPGGDASSLVAAALITASPGINLITHSSPGSWALPGEVTGFEAAGRMDLREPGSFWARSPPGGSPQCHCPSLFLTGQFWHCEEPGLGRDWVRCESRKSSVTTAQGRRESGRRCRRVHCHVYKRKHWVP